jgi:hypothetical protein
MRLRLGNAWTASAHPFAPDPDAGTGTGTGTGAGGTGTAGGGTGTGDGGNGGQSGAGADGTGTGTATAPTVPATLNDVTADSAWPAYATAHGIPAVAVRDLTDPAHREAFWQFHARKNEARIPKDLDMLRTKAQQWDDLAEASRTEQERAIADAERRGREAAIAELGGSTAATLIRAGIGNKRTDEEVGALLAPLDLSKFVGDNGAVDAGKVSQFVQTVIGGNAGGGSSTQRQRIPGMGQGHRTETTGRASAADGAARYAERRGSSATRNGSGGQ